MNEMELKKALTSVTPEVPEQFHLRMEQTLESIVAQEAQMKNSTKKAIRFSARTVVLAAALAVMMCAVALAATQWHLFDSLSFMTGKDTPVNAGLVMQSDLYQDPVMTDGHCWCSTATGCWMRQKPTVSGREMFSAMSCPRA